MRSNKKDAEKVLNKLLREKDLGNLAEPSRQSLNDYLDHWLETAVKPRVRERTRKEYSNTVRRYVREPLGAMRLSAIRPVDILVFCNANGDPAHESSIAQMTFKPTLRRAGLSEALRLYDLRHTHATLLLLANVNPKIVSERLGHASVKITLDTYSHVLPNMQQEAAEKLDALLYATPEPRPREAAN